MCSERSRKRHGLQNFNQVLELIFEDDLTSVRRAEVDLRPPPAPTVGFSARADGRMTRPLATCQELLCAATPMPLRQATVLDIDAMHAVRLAVRENALSDENSVRPEHYRAVLGASGRGWVHEESDNVVGFGIADHAQRNIWALFVAPGFEGQGIGRGLLDVMVTWLFAQSRDPVWLTTGRNTRAEHFYSAAAWRAMGPAADGEIRFELSAGSLPLIDQSQMRSNGK